MRRVRVVIGLVGWLALTWWLLHWFHSFMLEPQADGHRVAVDLWDFATAKRRFIKMELGANWPLEIGDPIYVVTGLEEIRQVGEVRRVPVLGQADGDRIAEALLYPAAPAIDDRTTLTLYETPRDMSWVMETMLPPEKRLRIAQEILVAYEMHHGQILAALRPIVVDGFTDAIEIVERDLTAALRDHRDELEGLVSRYQDRLVEQEVVPLVRKEIWPIVQQHAEPVANQIGQELFERASLWRFGWRALYDKSFLPEKDLTQQEWNRFVNEDALSVLDDYRGEIIAVQRRILEDISQNPQVQQTVHRNLTRIIDDPEFRSVVWEIFREVLVDNSRLRDQLEKRWQTDEAQRAVRMAADFVEPSIRRIGDMLFGTRRDGIAPEFAQVLRNQILDKDRHWLVLNSSIEAKHRTATAASDLLVPVRRGGHPQVNPFAVQLQGMK